MKAALKDKIITASENDKSLLCDRSQSDDTLGHNPLYLLEVHGITKSDLIRLEREGLAIKARYATENKTILGKLEVTGPQRIRWIIFKEVLNDETKVHETA